MRNKVVYIISDVNKSLAFEWIATYINKQAIDLSFILLTPSKTVLEEFLLERGFDVYQIQSNSKKDWIPAIIKTYKHLKKINPDVVHCHLLQANIIGLLAAKMAHVKKRIYTRHHSSQHHVYQPKGVLWDKLANSLSTQIIAISDIVKKILIEWEKVPESKVELIPHGFLLEEFYNVGDDRIQDFKKLNNLNNKAPVIGVVSRFTEVKGIQYIIPAFESILKNYPEAVLLMLNAYGDYENVINVQLEKLPETSYRCIRFEKDIAAAYKAMDVFIHVPIDEHSEAFGQIYIEALAAGVPSVFTRSGIANAPYFTDEIAHFVTYKNADEIAIGIKKLLTNKDRTNEMVKAGYSLTREFNISKFINRLENLYS
jgi:glycosyltransferase involved in cell wall biosynthesis